MNKQYYCRLYVIHIYCLIDKFGRFLDIFGALEYYIEIWIESDIEYWVNYKVIVFIID
jgi:hypothetical protein